MLCPDDFLNSIQVKLILFNAVVKIFHDLSVLRIGQAWYMVRPWLGQPTREVVRFVQSEQLPEQPTKSDGADTQKFWLLHNA